MTDVKAEAKAVEGAKQVSWFDPTHKDLINKHTTMFIPDSRVSTCKVINNFRKIQGIERGLKCLHSCFSRTFLA